MVWGRVRAARVFHSGIVVMLSSAAVFAVLDSANAQAIRRAEPLWASPTGGKPIDVASLPSGSQLIVAIRPAELLAHAEGAKLFDARSLGDLAAWFNQLSKQTGVTLEDTEQLLLAFSSEGELSFVVECRQPLELPKLPKAWGDPKKQSLGGIDVFVGGERMYIVRGRTIASAPPTSETDLGASDLLPKSPTFLRRELEELLAYSDSQRHLTVLVAPQFLFAGGDQLLAALPLPLRQELKSLAAPDGRQMTKAALASFHLGDEYLFAELRVHGGTSYRPLMLVRDISKVFELLPGHVDAYFRDQPPSRYSQELLAQYPKMLTAADHYLRTGVERRHAVFRTALPVAAAHNLTLATRLAVAERRTPSDGVSITRTKTLEEKLSQRITLIIPRDSFDRIAPALAEELGVEIHLAGGDLQLEGITKGFSFKYQVNEVTGHEALNELARIVNPDRSATGLDDPKQKLVYVIDDSRGPDRKRIVFTTRAMAKKRGKPPAVFGIK